MVDAELVETVGEAAFEGVGELDLGLGGSSVDAAIGAMSAAL